MCDCIEHIRVGAPNKFAVAMFPVENWLKKSAIVPLVLACALDVVLLIMILTAEGLGAFISFVALMHTLALTAGFATPWLFAEEWMAIPCVMACWAFLLKG